MSTTTTQAQPVPATSSQADSNTSADSSSKSQSGGIAPLAPATTASTAPPDLTGGTSHAVATALQALKEHGNLSSHLLSQTGGGDPSALNAILSFLGKNASHDQVKEAAAETLTNLSQAAAAAAAANGQAGADPNIHPGLQEQAGPSTHPHGPPNLGQSAPDSAASMVSVLSASPTNDGKPRRRTGPPTVNGVIMGSEEWTRQRKDNHKEVERRRRSNINEGINELARIVPNGTGEKAKGAILSRAVQYIHHLRENETRNIEKWTLEKLLMDQAMGDLQSQLEEHRSRCQDETARREKVEQELAAVKAELSALKLETAGKSQSGEGDGETESERAAKRQRTDA